jgi:hypothetical protein
MRVVLIAAVFLTAMLFDLRPAPAAGHAPWCAVLNMGPGDAYWDCQYASSEACRPNVLAGNRGFCNPNPRFEGWYGPGEPPRKHGKRRYRRG